MDHQTLSKSGRDNVAIDVEGLEQLVLKLEDEIKHEPVDPLEEDFDELMTGHNENNHSDVIAKILRNQQNPEIITELTIDSNRQVVPHKKNKSGKNSKVSSSKQKRQVKKKPGIKKTLQKSKNRKPKVVKSVKVSAVKHSLNKLTSSVSSEVNVTPSKPAPSEQMNQLPPEIAIAQTSDIRSEQLKPAENCTDSNIDAVFDIDKNEARFSNDSSEVYIDSDIQNDNDLFVVREKKKVKKYSKKSTLLMDSSDLLKKITKDRVKLVSTKRTWGPCEICQKSFATLSSLRTHTLLHSDPTQFACDVCHKNFTRLAHLKRHASKHTGKKVFQCGLCPKTYNTGTQLRRHHILSHTNLTESEDVAPELFEKPYSCDTCGARFRWQELLKTHVEKSCNRGSFECNRLNKHEHRWGRDRHQIKHTGERNYKCDTCGFIFTKRCHLVRHMKKIHVEKTCHRCTECAEEFFYEAKLTEHYLTAHRITKPYCCDRCNMKFQHQKRLKIHKLTHKDKENVFECELCFKKLSNLDSLYLHSSVHDRHEIYTCGACDKRFLDFNDIRKHIEKNHFKSEQGSCPPSSLR